MPTDFLSIARSSLSAKSSKSDTAYGFNKIKPLIFELTIYLRRDRKTRNFESYDSDMAMFSKNAIIQKWDPNIKSY